MNESLLNIIEEKLPPLSDTVVKLRDYIAEAGESVGISKVVDILSKDPMVTTNLLKIANSAYYGFSSKISTINQVVALLGIDNIKNLVMTDSIRSQLKVNVSPYGLDTDIFMGNCSKEVNFISTWLANEDKKLSQMLVPCAMLLRLGMILFSIALIKTRQDKDFRKMLEENGFMNVALVEQEFFGTDHISFLAYCFDLWKFDDDMIQTVLYATSPHSATRNIQKSAYALAIANRIFEPYEGGNEYNINEAIALAKEANQQGVSFDMDNLLAHIPVPQDKK